MAYSVLLSSVVRNCANPTKQSLTVDKRLRYKQNVKVRAMAVIVIDAPGTKFSDLFPLIPAVEAALLQAEPGTVTVVSR
jgi:hypothetical protein